MKKFTILLVLSCMMSFSFAQQERKCATQEHLEFQIQQDPDMIQRMQDIEAFTQHVIASGAAERTVEGVITIPVVVHVLYHVNRPQENLSMAQIQSQIDVMNEDFRRQNADASETLPQFESVAADLEIEFCLASVDPQGNPSTGVERRSSTRNSWGTGTVMKRTAQGGFDAWPRDSYLNMWSCNIGGGILGFATFPGGAAANDGVVASPNYFGSDDYDTNNDFYLSSPYHLGRTMTHEVGHWLNLRHIWGDGGCGVDDLVGDTPQSDASNGGCAINHMSCGSLDMVQNYMDYSYDDCMNIYTAGQRERARALFEPGGARVALLNSIGCGVPDPVCLPPTAVTLTLGDEVVEVSFNGAYFADFYVIEGALAGETLEELGTVDDPQFGQVSPVSFSIGELSSCTDYEIRITAICSNLEGEESTEVIAFTTTGAECVPPSCETPEGLYATEIGWQRATLGWEPTEYAESYRVQGRLRGGLGIFTRTKEVEGTSFRTNKLFPFLTYEFHVQSLCGDLGNSPYSPWFPFTLNPITNPGVVGHPNGQTDLLEEVKLFDTDHIISTYPNPSFGPVSLTYKNGIDLENVRIAVTDIMGKEVREFDIDLLLNGTQQIDLSGLNNGMYLLTFEKDGILLNTEKVMLAK